MKQVLVLEDESDVRELLILHLKREGYATDAFEQAEDAWSALKGKTYDLMILDWMLPRMSGLDLCKKIRTELGIRTPILLLTARAETMDKVIGLEVGADDYLTKPFEIREFIARVRALLRRSQVQEGASGTNTSPSVLTLDEKATRILLRDRELTLTPHEYKLLAAMIKSPGTTLERATLVALIQGPGVAVVDRTVDTTIVGIRKKLGTDADLIETIRGFGYRLQSGVRT
jgi:two-component system phosphate regulon response regulator PhoB